MSEPGRSDTRVVVVGPVMEDVVARLAHPLAYGSDTPATVTRQPGGAGANVSAWLAHVGLPVTLVCRVGGDAAGRAAVSALGRAGVRVLARRDPRARTGACVVLVGPDGERSMLPDQGANAALSADDVPADAFVPGAHLHLSGYVLLDDGSREAGRRALTLARAAGMTVSVDPASAAPLAETGAQRFLGWVRGVDLLTPNAAEARVLSGHRDVETAVRALAPGVGAVVCTLGPSGAMWYADAARPVRVPAQAARVVDTTGAGDAFVAGFLSRWLGTGSDDDVSAALGEGCRLAALAVASDGGQPG